MRKRGESLTYICKICGGEFLVKYQARKTRRFCSRKCACKGRPKRTEESRKNLSLKMQGKGNPFYGRKHTEFSKKKNSQTQLSKNKKHTQEFKDYLSTLFSGKNGPFYGRTHTPEALKKMSRLGWRHSEETKERISQSTKGSKNHNWKGGCTDYGEDFTRYFKTKIRKRDRFVCVICGKNGYCVHHIDYDKLNNNELNLITLCPSCHGKTNFNRDNWQQIFDSIVRFRIWGE